MRAWVAVAVAWIGGLVGAPFVGLEGARQPAALVALALGVCGLALAGRAPGERTRRAWRLALVAAAGIAGIAAGAVPPEPAPVPAGLCRLDAVVVSVRHGEHGAASDLRVVRGERIRDGAPVAAGARVRVYAPMPRGARVRVIVRVRGRARYRNPTPHPEWPAVGAPDALGWLPRGAAVRVVRRNAAWDALEALRAAVRRDLEATLSPRAAAIARALVLGDAGAVSGEDRTAVRDAGLAHILAVSGLHVSLLAGLALLAVRRVLLLVRPLAARHDPTRLAAALALPLAPLHAAFAGGAPSAWRAGITAAITWALLAAGRRPRALPVAAAAALALGAAAPGDAARPGFLLSILATAAVVTTPMPDPGSRRGALGAAFAVSWRTAVATAPVVLWCFGDVPVVGVVANLLLMPVGALLLVPLAVAHAVTAWGLPPLAPVTAAAFEPTAAAFVAACDAFASIPPDVAPPPPTVAQGILFALGCGALLFLRRWRVRVAAAFATCLAMAAAELAVRHAERPRGVLRVTFVDVGQGDAALVDLPDGRLMLVDAGGTRSPGADPGARVLVPLLRARRRHRVDIAVLSHPHPDHYGGLAAVLDAVPVGELWDSGQAEAEEPGTPAARLLARARSLGTPVRTPGELCDAPRRFGDAEVRLLWPCPRYDPGFDPNDNSLVLRIALGRRAILLTGDVEALAEERLATGDRTLGSDVLKVPHHGSRTSTTDAFLAAVHPRLALISAGRGNRYDHPHPEVLSRLKRRGIRTIRLDRAGGTVVWTDGDRLAVTPWRGDPFELP